MIQQDSNFIVLNYLYNKGEAGEQTSKIESDLLLNKLSAKRTYETLVTNEYAKGFASEENGLIELIISPKGELFVEEERDTFLNEIINEYDFALIKFLYRENKPLALEDFVEELKTFAPKTHNSIGDGNLIHSLYRLSNFIENKNSGQYQINNVGKTYYENEVKNRKLKNERQEKLMNQIPTTQNNMNIGVNYGMANQSSEFRGSDIRPISNPTIAEATQPIIKANKKSGLLMKAWFFISNNPLISTIIGSLMVSLILYLIFGKPK